MVGGENDGRQPTASRARTKARADWAKYGGGRPGRSDHEWLCQVDRGGHTGDSADSNNFRFMSKRP